MKCSWSRYHDESIIMLKIVVAYKDIMSKTFSKYAEKSQALLFIDLLQSDCRWTHFYSTRSNRRRKHDDQRMTNLSSSIYFEKKNGKICASSTRLIITNSYVYKYFDSLFAFIALILLISVIMLHASRTILVCALPDSANTLSCDIMSRFSLNQNVLWRKV